MCICLCVRGLQLYEYGVCEYDYAIGRVCIGMCMYL